MINQKKTLTSQFIYMSAILKNLANIYRFYEVTPKEIYVCADDSLHPECHDPAPCTTCPRFKTR